MRIDHTKINTTFTIGSKFHTCRMTPKVEYDHGVRLELSGHTITGDDNYVYTGVEARLTLKMSKSEFLAVYEAMHRINTQLHQQE